MYSFLAALLDSAPVTGDDFPAKKLLMVLAIAIGIMVLLGVVSVVAGKKSEGSGDKDGKDGSDSSDKE
jgi:hypothetical protein